MIFLNPAILFGLIAAAIPVLLHFLNLQKLKRIEFSTLSFLKELQKTKIRKLKFKQWLLLALRVLLVLLLVSAFARPTLETFTIGGSSSAKTSSIFILDNSFSMSAAKESGSYFNNAKEIIKNIVGDYQEGDEAVIIYTTEENDKKLSTNLSEIEKELNNANVSVRKQNFAEAIQQAQILLSESQNFNKELFILSDFPISELDSNVNAELLEFDNNTKVYLFDFSDIELSNRSITDLELNNQLLEPGKAVSFSAVVKNNTGGSIANGVASLFINGVRSAQQSYDLNEYETKSIQFESVLNDAGLINSFAEIEQDDILQDNRRYAAFFVPEKLNILLASDKSSDARFVKLAIQSSSEKRTINIKETSTSDIAYNLDPIYDLIVIIGTKKVNDLSSLNKFIESGARLILFPGSESERSDFQMVLAGLGLRADAPQIGAPNSTESIAYFNNVEYEHPIFSNLFEDRKDTKVESPEIYSYFKVTPYEQLFPIISLNDNSLFISEIKKGSGKILLFNTPPTLSWSNFPVKSLFAPLINKSILYQTMKNEGGRNIIAGESYDIKIANFKVPQLKIVKPDDTEEYINIADLSNQNSYSYSKTDQLGVYKCYSGDKLIDYISVNFDPAETSSQYADAEEIENYIAKLAADENYMFIDPTTDYKQEIKQARFGTELWKYLLIAALFIALIEMFVSKNAKKDFAEIKSKI